MNTMTYQTSSPLLSVEERQRCAAYLTRTRDSLLQAIAGLMDSQWHFKPAIDRWSIAEILEHLVIVEGRVHGVVVAMPEAPCTDGNRNDAEVERIILTEVPRRSPKISAPAHLFPSQEKSPKELLKSFVESRAVTMELLETAPALRGHILQHPILGLLDGYQWIMAVAAHTARHTEQIREIKADTRFSEALATCSGSLH